MKQPLVTREDLAQLEPFRDLDFREPDFRTTCSVHLPKWALTGPAHGSWLNQAEIEIGLFSRQCLGKWRIAASRSRYNHQRPHSALVDALRVCQPRSSSYAWWIKRRHVNMSRLSTAPKARFYCFQTVFGQALVKLDGLQELQDP